MLKKKKHNVKTDYNYYKILTLDASTDRPGMILGGMSEHIIATVVGQQMYDGKAQKSSWFSYRNLRFEPSRTSVPTKMHKTYFILEIISKFNLVWHMKPWKEKGNIQI